MNDLNCSKFKDRKCTQQIFYYNFSIIIELSSCYDFWYKKKIKLDLLVLRSLEVESDAVLMIIY